MSAEAVVLQIKNLEFHYDKPLLEIVDFEAFRGESVGVLGPSGCGKTTFMHLVAGLLRPARGKIRVAGTDITRLSEGQVDRIRGSNIGIVFQRLHLVPSLSVIDNLLLAQRLARTPIDRGYAMDLLGQLGIPDLANRKPHQLSQGQAQRVAIARSVAHRPVLLVADEPTSALDDENAEDAIKVLRELTTSTEAALIVVTHDERVRGHLDRVLNLGGAQ
jgi:ABC-type lipoprotein export system ATPase subunit